MVDSLKTSVGGHFLLRGAVYALEQCNHLLRSAVTLYNECDYATAVVLAMYSHEELGRYLILRKLRESVMQGERVSTHDIEECCENHVEKQTLGLGPISISAPRDSSLWKLIGTIMGVTPDDPDYWSARASIDEVIRRKRKRLPNDRHQIRVKALYVEPNDAGDDWNRPVDQEKTKARDALCEAVNAYAIWRDRLVSPVDASDTEFTNAMDAWAECPELPPPIWPNSQKPGT